MLAAIRAMLARLLAGAKSPAATPAAPSPAQQPQYPPPIRHGELQLPTGPDSWENPQSPVGSVPWEARYPEFALNDGRPVMPGGVTEEEEDERDSTPWVIAPAGSHVLSMKLIDRRQATQSSERDRLQIRHVQPALLVVRFKPSKRWGVREYEYSFSDPDRAKRIFQAMANSPSPWTIGHRELVVAKVPYERRV